VLSFDTPDRAGFELLPTAEADRVRADLALLQPGALAGVPPNTVVVLRAGHLVREALYHNARRELLAGIATDPDEPTLHQLLGRVYERTWLKSWPPSRSPRRTSSRPGIDRAPARRLPWSA
jgi:hypothetical protein